MNPSDRRPINDDMGMIDVPGAVDAHNDSAAADEEVFDYGFQGDAGLIIDDDALQVGSVDDDDPVDLFNGYGRADDEVQYTQPKKGLPFVAKASAAFVVVALVAGVWLVLKSGDSPEENDIGGGATLAQTSTSQSTTTSASPTTTAGPKLEAPGTVWEAKGPGNNDTPFEAITGFYSAYYGDQNGVGEKVAQFCPPSAENCNAKHYQSEVVGSVAPNTGHTLKLTSVDPGVNYSGLLTLIFGGSEKKYDTKFRVVQIDGKWYLADSQFTEVVGA